MVAFHGSQEIKQKYLDRVRAHRKADELIHGTYWQDGKGCAVGCTVHSGEAAIRLAVMRWSLRQARSIVWRADEWIHKQELSLRDFHGTGRDMPQLQSAIARECPTATDETAQEKPECRGNDFNPFPQLDLLADDIGAETDSMSRGGRRQSRAKAGRASAEAHPARPAVNWAQIKAENAQRRVAHRRPLWMMSTIILAVALFCGSAAYADTFDLTGTVTMTGALIGPCGVSTCVETLDFTAVVTTSAPFDFFGTTAYVDTLQSGNVTASGPLVGDWTIGLWQGYAGGYTGLYFLNSADPYAEIDAPGFNSPTGYPQSFSGPAWWYTCAGTVCQDFGFQSSGWQTITAVDPPTATPEPSAAMLLLLPLLANVAKYTWKFRPIRAR